MSRQSKIGVLLLIIVLSYRMHGQDNFTYTVHNKNQLVADEKILNKVTHQYFTSDWRSVQEKLKENRVDIFIHYPSEIYSLQASRHLTLQHDIRYKINPISCFGKKI